MKRKYLFFISLAFIVLSGFLYQPVANGVVSFCLKEFCRQNLGGNLQYERLYKGTEGKWVVENPRVISTHPIEEGGHCLYAERAEFQLDFRWLKRRASLQCSLSAPKLEIGKGALDLKQLFSTPKKHPYFYNLAYNLKIPDGFIALHDENGVSQLMYALDLSLPKSPKGTLVFWLGEKVKKNSLEISLSKPSGERPQVLLQFNETQCPDVAQTLAKIWPQASDLLVTQGRLNGELKIEIASNGKIKTEGDAVLHELTFAHPLFKIEGSLPETRLTLANGGEKAPIGRLEFVQNGCLNLLDEKGSYCTLKDLSGNLFFLKHEGAKLLIEGICHHKEIDRPIKLEGSARFNSDKLGTMNLGLQVQDEKQGDIFISLFARQLSALTNLLEIEIANFSVNEFQVFRTLFEDYIPEVRLLDLHAGVVNGSLQFYLQQGVLQNFNLEKLSASGLNLDLHPWEISIQADKILSSLSLNLGHSDFSEALNADMQISNGKLNFEVISGQVWQFNGINTNLSVRNGILQKTSLTGELGGLIGNLEIDGNNPETLMKAHFSGPFKGLALLVPERIKKGMENHFADEWVMVEAKGKKKSTGIVIEGHTIIGIGEKRDTIFPFGYELQVPDQKRAYTGFLIKNGWFEAKNIPLAKFVSPFLFYKETIKLSGIGDFQGSFDHQGITLHYNAEDFMVESRDFAMEAKSFRTPESDRLPAIHFVDFANMESYGSIPVHHGTYFEKNTGLLFTDINALINLEDKRIHIPEIESFCNGVYFAGNMDVDWNYPQEGHFDVNIHTEVMNGKFSQMQQFFSHFKKPFFFLKLPGEGQVSLRQQGAFLKFAFQPNGSQFDARVQGMITDGSVELEGTDLSLQELSLNFEYDHRGNSLEFNELQGTMLVGKPGRVEEYALISDRIRFRDLSQAQGEFDFWISDKKRDLIRVAGKTNSYYLEDQPSIEIKLDHALTHFGDVHPTSFQLVLNRDWSQIDLFHMELDFRLGTLFHDLQRFSRTGLFFLSRHLLKRLNDLKRAEGDFNVVLDYDATQSLLAYRATGDNLSIENYQCTKCLLNGKKKNSSWMVDQLQLDDISLAADFSKEHEDWKINFLGLRAGQSLLLGLEGMYKSADHVLDAQLNLFESDLSCLSEWSALKRIADEFHLGGFFRGHGKMHLQFTSNAPGYQLNTEMKGSLLNGNVKGLYFHDIDNLSFQFKSDQGIILSGLKTALKSVKDQASKAALEADRISISVIDRELAVKGLRFNIPTKNLGWLTDNLQQNFPDEITHQTAETLRYSKKEGNFSGTLDMTLAKPYYAFHLCLDEDVYQFLNKPHALKNFVMDLNPFELKVLTQYTHSQHTFWLQAKSLAPKFDHGELILSDADPLDESFRDIIPLTVHWKNDPFQGLLIQKGEGNFAGIAFNFVQDPLRPSTDKSLNLKGTLKIDFAYAAPLLPLFISKQITDWEIGKGYYLQGEWEIGKKENVDLIDQVVFNGEFGGRDVELSGYQFQQLSSKLSLAPHRIAIQDPQLSDRCGRVYASEINLFKGEHGQWVLTSPLLTVEEFRPSLLQPCAAPVVQSNKPLVIQHIYLHDLQGVVGDKTSFTGRGELAFSNQSRKNLQNTIFAIPAEILSRIGLDIGVLNPVTGSIFYEMRDGKFVLNRFKDIYSEGRLSKFYLPTSPYESFMDFKGNLNVKVRMKQYNLLFKLAELFTVTIKGTILKPTYTLKKQNQPSQDPREVVIEK